MPQRRADIRPEGGIVCSTCHEWHPTEDHIGRWGWLVAECSKCRRIRKMKQDIRDNSVDNT